MSARARGAPVRGRVAADHFLRTPRLLLRPFAESDFDAVHAYASDPQVTAHLRWGPNTETETRTFLSGAVRYGRGPKQYDFAVTEAESARVVGSIGLRRREVGCDEIGYLFARASWGRGYATEAVTRIVRFAVETTRTEEIFGLVVPANIASRRVLLRCGFTPAPDPVPYAAWMEGFCATAEVLRLGCAGWRGES